MTSQPAAFELWITATNRAYRGVPFNVVTDWLQQGRLLPTDRIRQGQGAWHAVADLPALAAFLPRADAQSVDDAAEALVPVTSAIVPRRYSDEDDDVDMIPLIDISLVLLIFFMMTATVAVGGAKIETPLTQYGVEFTQDKSMLWIGVDRRDDGQPSYSLGTGDMQAAGEDSGLTLEQVLKKLDARLATHAPGAMLRIAAHKQISYGVVQRLTAELERRRATGRIAEIKAEVNEKSS